MPLDGQKITAKNGKEIWDMYYTENQTDRLFTHWIPCPYREIQFRGWCIALNRWVYGDLITTEFRGCNPPCISYGNTCAQVHEDSIGQFTGQEDCMGNRIYEGDIVALETGSLNVKGDVEYSRNEGAVVFSDGHFYVKKYPLWEKIISGKGVVVVGNHYESMLQKKRP